MTSSASVGSGVSGWDGLRRFMGRTIVRDLSYVNDYYRMLGKYLDFAGLVFGGGFVYVVDYEHLYGDFLGF